MAPPSNLQEAQKKRLRVPSSLDALYSSLQVEPGHVLLTNHPRHDMMFAVESVEQISDGSTLQVHVPKKRVFISAPNVKNKAVVWYAGATASQIERSIAKAAGLGEAPIECRDGEDVDGSRKPSEVVLERGVVTGEAEKPGPESRQLVGLPDLSLWERCFEVFATLTTGVIFIAKLLNPLSLFIASCALLWIAWGVFQLFRHGGRILSSWGVRVDQPNLKHSFILPSLFSLVALGAICIGTAVQNRSIYFDNWHLWLIFALYPFYGVLQHVMLQSFLMRHLSWLVTGKDDYSVLQAFLKERNLRNFLATLGCVLVSATAFAMVHWPDIWLMAGTGMMGVPWAVEYLLHRNVLPLGLYHGFVGTLFYFWFMGRVTASSQRRVRSTGSGELRRTAASASQRLATTKTTSNTSPGRQRSPTRSQKLTGSVGGSTTPTAHQSAPEEHCLHVLAGHTGAVLCLCGVGDILFTGSQDSSIMIWDLNNLQYIGTLPGHRGFVKCLHASYAKKVLCSGSQDRTIRVWSLETFSTVKTLMGHVGGVNAVLILESLDLLISGSEDRSIRIWDLGTYEVVSCLEQSHLGGVFALEKFGSPVQVVSGARDRSLKVWDTSTWTVNKTLHPPHYDGVTSIAVAAKHGKFYSGSRDRSIKEWDMYSLTNTMHTLHVHGDWIQSLCMSPSDDILFSGSKDGVVKVWDGELQCQDVLQGHKGAVTALETVGNRLFSSSTDRAVRVWRIDQYG
ncbi:unnamed protein product [Cladocopium goreaui]|uniref:Myosin heavy chain kinase B (MHCK-B) n=1 Tax=Cladocopium goreaui TaxID=2562237 RepID=A0A9P1M4T5_9DINO|nr:unnamed protein product [Cladocopium goreaui]